MKVLIKIWRMFWAVPAWILLFLLCSVCFIAAGWEAARNVWERNI